MYICMKTTISITLDVDIAEQAKELLKKDGKALSHTIEELLKALLQAKNIQGEPSQLKETGKASRSTKKCKEAA